MLGFAYVVGLFYLVVGVNGTAELSSSVWQLPRITVLVALVVLNLLVLMWRGPGVKLSPAGWKLVLAWIPVLTFGVAATIYAPDRAWSMVGAMGDGLLYWFIVAGFVLSNAAALRVGGREVADAQRTGVLAGVLAVAVAVFLQTGGIGDGAALVDLARGQMPNGFFAHRGHASFVLAFGALLALLEFMRGRLAPWSFGAYYSVVCAALWLASTRGAILALAVALVYLIARRVQWRTVVAAGAWAAVVFGSVQMVYGFGFRGQVEALTSAQSVTGGRFGHWQRAIALWPERPLLGFGFGGYRYADDLSQGGNTLTVKAHNLVLDVLVSRGLLGLAALAVLWYVAGRSMRGGYRAFALLYLGFCLTWFEAAEYSHLAWWAVSIGSLRLVGKVERSELERAQPETLPLTTS